MSENGNLLYSAKGCFTISTAWTSTMPFSGLSTVFISAAVAKVASVTRAINVGGTGDLYVIMFDGSTGYFPSTPGGYRHDIRAIALSSKNTATGLTGMY